MSRFLANFALMLPVAAAFLPSAPVHRSHTGVLRSVSGRPHGLVSSPPLPLRERRLGRAGGVGLKLDMKEKTPGELPLIRPDALEKAFVQMDRDKSGELNQEEVNDVLRELGYTTVESKCLFDHMDIDHNGKITKSEFVRGCVSEGICAIDDDPINYEDGEHVVVSNDDREPEENITMLGFYTRLLQYTEKKTQVLGEAGEVGHVLLAPHNSFLFRSCNHKPESLTQEDQEVTRARGGAGEGVAR
eukprot:3940083-Rhodomonas_salina.1